MIRKIFGLFSVVVLLMVAGCSLKEPVLPSWFVTLNIPLSESTYELSRFINEDSTITQGQNNLLFISIKDTLDPSGLTDLSLEPQNDTSSIGIESIRLDSLKDWRTDTTSLRDLLPGLSSLVGDSATIPDTTFPSLSAPIEADDFKRIHVVSGSVTLRLRNNLPVPIGPNLSLALLNDSLNQDIINITIPDTIFPGQSGEGSDQIPLGGMWIYSKLRVDYDLPVAQPTTIFVTDSLLDSSGFWMEIDFEDFEADEVVARVQKQQFSRLNKFPLESENKMRSGKVDRGNVRILFRNDINVNSKVDFTLPNIITPMGPFSDTVEIPGNDNTLIEFDMDSYEVINPNNPNEFIDSVEIDLTITTDSPSDFVHITSGDSIAVLIETDTISFEEFRGFLASDTIEVPEFSQDSIADYGDFSGGIQLQDASLEIDFLSAILVENLSVNLNLTGYHDDKNGVRTDSATLNVTQDFNTLPPNDPNINISLSGPDVAEFLNILPTSIRGTASFRIEGEIEYHKDNKVSGDYHFSTPLRLVIQDLAPIVGDVTTFVEKGDDTPYGGLTDTLDQDVIDFGEDLQSGELQLEIVNHTPVAVRVRMLVTTSLSRPDSAFFTEPIVDSLEFIKSATLEAADTDPQSGFVITSRRSTISLDLTNDQIKMLTQPPFRVGYELKIFDSQGVIALRSTDFVKAFGLAKLIVKIEDD